MIITVRNETESEIARDMIKRAGYEFAMSYFYTQEWRKEEKVILLHKEEKMPRRGAGW